MNNQVSQKYHINPYLYAKGLFEIGKKEDAIDFLNDFFFRKNGKEIFEKNEHFSPASLGKSFPGFIALNFLPHSGQSISVALHSKISFGELWSTFFAYSPTDEIFRLLWLAELPSGTSEGINSRNKILGTLNKMLNEGWIILDEENLSKDLPQELTGRVYIDLTKFEIERNEALLSLPEDFFIIFATEQFNTDLQPSRNFWAKQKLDTTSKSFDNFLFAVFHPLHSPLSQCKNRLNRINQFEPDFLNTAIGVGREILGNCDQNLLDKIPSYCGFENQNGRKWLSDLLEFCHGKNDTFFTEFERSSEMNI